MAGEGGHLANTPLAFVSTSRWLGRHRGVKSQSRLLVGQSKSAREAEVLLLCRFEFEIIFTV